MHAAEGGLERAGSLRYASYAVHDTGGGTLHLQFNHLTPVVLATALELAGPGAMFRVPALVAAIGLLLVYAAAVRATRRPWASLLAPALLGVSMPFLYVARDTF